MLKTSLHAGKSYGQFAALLVDVDNSYDKFREKLVLNKKRAIMLCIIIECIQYY